MLEYIPTNWYWRADDGRVFSSKAGALVSTKDKAYAAWQAAGGIPTRWPADDDGKQTNAALGDVLAPYGVTVATSPETIKAAVVARFRAFISGQIENAAKARGYDGAVSCASYASSTIPAWAAEATAFVAWRDAMWGVAIGILADVESGKAKAPTEAELAAALPVLSWPA